MNSSPSPKSQSVPWRAKKPQTLVLALVSLLASACATTDGVKVVLQQDSTVYVGKEKGVQKKRLDVVDSKNQPMLIESPGHASLYLLPVPGDQDGSQLEATLRPLDSWGSGPSKKKLNELLNEVVPKVSEIQILMASNKTKEALVAIEQLKSRYPELTYLNFLHASCLVLAGERDKARVLLETALKDFPGNQDGRRLFKLLKGDEGSLPPQPAETPAEAGASTSNPPTAVTPSTSPDTTTNPGAGETTP